MSTVPALADANLSAFTDVGRNAWSLMTEVGFRYDSTQAVQADDTVWARIASGQVDVTEGFTEADTVVNALLSAAARQTPPSLSAQVKAHQAFEDGLKQMFAQGK